MATLAPLAHSVVHSSWRVFRDTSFPDGYANKRSHCRKVLTDKHSDAQINIRSYIFIAFAARARQPLDFLAGKCAFYAAPSPWPVCVWRRILSFAPFWRKRVSCAPINKRAGEDQSFMLLEEARFEFLFYLFGVGFLLDWGFFSLK